MTEVTIYPSDDAYLYKLQATYNFGAASLLLLNNNSFYDIKILFRFVLSSIPSSATINSATLRLYNQITVGSTTYNIYEIADDNGDWIEGTKQSSIAGAGEPCHNYKEYDTVSWAGSAGMNTAGTDYDTTVLATATAEIGNSSPIDLSFTASGLSVLQGWFGLETNNGFLLKKDATSSNQFSSKEAANSSYHPRLIIDYSTGGLLKVNMEAQMNKNMSGGMNG